MSFQSGDENQNVNKNLTRSDQEPVIFYNSGVQRFATSPILNSPSGKHKEPLVIILGKKDHIFE